MKLYRGVKDKPDTLTIQEEAELDHLNKQLDKITEKEKDPMASGAIFGPEKLIRRYNLIKKAGPQFFSDRIDVAREYALEGRSPGYLVTISVEPSIADEHYAGAQMLYVGKSIQHCDNYVFSGKELRELEEKGLLEVREEQVEGKVLDPEATIVKKNLPVN